MIKHDQYFIVRVYKIPWSNGLRMAPAIAYDCTSDVDHDDSSYSTASIDDCVSDCESNTDVAPALHSNSLDNKDTCETDRFKDDVKEMSSVMGSIVNKILRPSIEEDANPILSRRKAVERKIAEEALDARARSVLRTEERRLRDSAHRSIPRIGNREKRLRKMATAAVVQMFNALQTHQTERSRLERQNKRIKLAKMDAARLKVVDEQTKVDLQKDAAGIKSDLKSLSKSSFLELLKMNASR